MALRPERRRSGAKSSAVRFTSTRHELAAVADMTASRGAEPSSVVAALCLTLAMVSACEPATPSREPAAAQPSPAAGSAAHGDAWSNESEADATADPSGTTDAGGAGGGSGADAHAPGDEHAPQAAAPLVAPNGVEMRPCAPEDAAPADMACIPGGPFLRGSNEGPDHARPQAEVWVSTFYMDRNEVTVDAWNACVAAKACPKEGPQYVDFDRPQQPINGITWFGAKAFCESRGKRLPTEAEWEKAARGTDGRTYPWGEDEPTCALAVYKDPKVGRGCGLKKAGKDPNVGRPDLVGTRPANEYGLHDMAGNSWEWVADWWSKSYEACGEACQGVDPKGPCGGAETCTSTKQKIVRGGSWFWDAEHMTTYRRRAHFPSNEPFHHFGFRCAASLDAVAAVRTAGDTAGDAAIKDK